MKKINTMKKIHTILIFSIVLLIGSCGPKDQKMAEDNSPAISVTTSLVAVNDSSPFLSVSGKIQAIQSADISTRIMGYVSKVYVNVGDNVQKGQLLIAINNTDLQAKRAQVNAGITEATVAFTTAQTDYKRYKNLFAKQSASQKEMDDMAANFEMAKARLESANQMKNEVNAQFAYSNITAPFSGVITAQNSKEGAMANPGMPLISMEAPGNFEVMALVPETEITEIKKGTTVAVVVKSIHKTIAGKVMEVSSSAKNTGGQYLVKIELDKTDANILSGMFTTVQFPVERKEQVRTVMIPKQAIVTNGQLSGVYTVSQRNTALLRWLRLGRSFGDQVEVLSGLQADEAYIVSAEGKLYNGVRVNLQ